MPSVTVSRIIEAPPAEVWAAVSEIDRLREWNPRWTRIELTSETTRGTGASFRTFTEEGDQFEFRITGWVEGEFVEISPVREADERHGITLQSQSFQLASADDGAATFLEVGAHVSTHGPRGWLLGLVFWRGYQRRGLNDALNALQDLLEPPDAEPNEAEPLSE